MKLFVQCWLHHLAFLPSKVRSTSIRLVLVTALFTSKVPRNESKNRTRMYTRLSCFVLLACFVYVACMCMITSTWMLNACLDKMHVHEHVCMNTSAWTARFWMLNACLDTCIRPCGTHTCTLVTFALLFFAHEWSLYMHEKRVHCFWMHVSTLPHACPFYMRRIEVREIRLRNVKEHARSKRVVTSTQPSIKQEPSAEEGLEGAVSAWRQLRAGASAPLLSVYPHHLNRQFLLVERG